MTGDRRSLSPLPRVGMESLLAAPLLLYLVLFVAYPTAYAVKLAATDTLTQTFPSLASVRLLWDDRLFWRAVLGNLVLPILSVAARVGTRAGPGAPARVPLPGPALSACRGRDPVRASGDRLPDGHALRLRAARLRQRGAGGRRRATRGVACARPPDDLAHRGGGRRVACDPRRLSAVARRADGDSGRDRRRRPRSMAPAACAASRSSPYRCCGRPCSPHSCCAAWMRCASSPRRWC